jgi:MFS family permease
MAYGSGYLANFADIAPGYSSIIFSVSSTISTIGALVSNIIAGLVIKQPILEDWRKLFILFSIIYIIGGVIFLLYGSAIPRKWATLNSEKSKQNEKDEALTMLPQQTDIPSIATNIESNQSIDFPE